MRVPNVVKALVVCALLLLGSQWGSLQRHPSTVAPVPPPAPRAATDAAPVQRPPFDAPERRPSTAAPAPPPALVAATDAAPARRPPFDAPARAAPNASAASAPMPPPRDVLPPFNWDELVNWRLATWDKHWQDARVRTYDLDDLERLCEQGNGLIFCTRLQIVGRRLFFKDVRALELDRDYAVSRIAPFIDLIRHDESMPDLDLFLALNDQPSVAWGFRGKEALRHQLERPPPMFGSTMHPRRADIAWPDYSFWLPTRPHKTRTPPWEAVRAQVYAQGLRIPWEQRLDLAFFAGDTRHPVRKKMLRIVALPHNEHLFAIRTVWIHRAAATCADSPQLDDGGAGIREPGCRYAPPDYCKYKYLLNLGSGGNYANKLKYMLLCRSLVIHVSDGNSVRPLAARAAARPSRGARGQSPPPVLSRARAPRAPPPPPARRRTSSSGSRSSCPACTLCRSPTRPRCPRCSSACAPTPRRRRTRAASPRPARSAWAR